jgi:hypothetical protein
MREPMKSILFLALFITFAPVARCSMTSAEIDQERESSIQEMLPDVVTDTTMGELVNLKGGKHPSLVLQVKMMQALYIRIYDRDKKGRYIGKERLEAGSQYEEAKADFPMIGNHQFIRVIFEGNTGTETLQKIMALVVWSKGRFVTCMMETISYDMGSTTLGSWQKYSLDITFDSKDPENITAMLKHSYQRKYEELHETSKDKFADYRTFESKWDELLVWKEKENTFYHKEKESKNLKDAFGIIRNIATTRQAFLQKRPDPKALSRDIKRLQLMEILP